ncbi:MAG: anti-sigma factor family protein [Anaerolineales bacterium]
MSPKRWTNMHLSAYLDGELSAGQQRALEAELAENPGLRQRLNELRHTVALVQGMPMREPPRNYLLTPSMVAEKKPQRRERARPSLWVMRLATALSAAAFVIVVGLQLALGSGGVLYPVAMSERATEDVVVQEMEAEDLAVAETVPVEGTAEPMMQMEAPEALVEESEESAEVVPGEPPSWEGSWGDEGMGGAGEGIGGGGELDLGAAEATEQPVAGAEEEAVEGPRAASTKEAEADAEEVEEAEADTAGEEALDDADEEASPESATRLLATPEGSPLPSEPTLEFEEITPPTEETTEESARQFWQWLAALLGVSTLALGGATLWLSSRQP